MEKPSPDEIVERGEKIYNEKYREEYERKYRDSFVVIRHQDRGHLAKPEAGKGFRGSEEKGAGRNLLPDPGRLAGRVPHELHVGRCIRQGTLTARGTPARKSKCAVWDGRKHALDDVVIDTGFSGFLQMPKSLAAVIRLEDGPMVESTLADNRKITMETAYGTGGLPALFPAVGSSCCPRRCPGFWSGWTFSGFSASPSWCFPRARLR